MPEASVAAAPAPAQAPARRNRDRRRHLPFPRARTAKNTGPAENRFCRDRSETLPPSAYDAREAAAARPRWPKAWFAETDVTGAPGSAHPPAETRRPPP